MADNIPVRMVRDNLENIPQFELPSLYTIRPYQPGDEANWLRIHVEAEEYQAITSDLFDREFGRDEQLLTERQFYLCDATGEAIGTATAWFKTFGGQPYGRVHWVAIVPWMQGRGLAKPLMTIICRRLCELRHDKVFLDTSTGRIPAISLYLTFGFRPDIKSEQDAQAWRLIREKIRPLLDNH